MNWKVIGMYAWHGLSQAAITAGASIAVLQAWPTKLQWLILWSGAVVAFFKGVDGYRAVAESSRP